MCGCHVYLARVVDPDSALWVAHSHLLSSWRPADPVQSWSALNGNAGRWYLGGKKKKKWVKRTDYAFFVFSLHVSVCYAGFVSATPKTDVPPTESAAPEMPSFCSSFLFSYSFTSACNLYAQCLQKWLVSHFSNKQWTTTQHSSLSNQSAD